MEVECTETRGLVDPLQLFLKGIPRVDLLTAAQEVGVVSRPA